MLYEVITDLAKISRFDSLIQKDDFLEKYFNQIEIEYVKSRGKAGNSSLAGRFAAREAFFKALGTGFSSFSPKDITILNDSKGKPYIEPGDKVIQHLNRLAENWFIHLSISHEKERNNFV